MLLDSYESERMPVAERLLNTTDQGFKLVVSDTWIAGLLRTKVIARLAAFAMRIEAVQRAAFRVVSQLGIHYRGGPLSSSVGSMPRGAPRAGDRFPWLTLRFAPDGPLEDGFEHLDDTCFHLLVIGQPGPAASLVGLGGLAKVHVLPSDAVNLAAFASAKVPSPSFYLIRPDGYIGLCGRAPDPAAIARYAKGRLRLG